MHKKTDAGRSVFMKESLIHLESLLRTAIYMTGDKPAADNLIQETYLRAYCLWGESGRAEGYRTRLFRALAGLLNEYGNAIRNAPDTRPPAFDGEDTLDDSELVRMAEKPDSDSLCSLVGGDDIKQAIQELPFEVRFHVVLSFVEGFSYQEIAEITETDIAAVKAKLREGRRYLQEELWRSVTDESLVRQPSSYN